MYGIDIKKIDNVNIKYEGPVGPWALHQKQCCILKVLQVLNQI